MESVQSSQKKSKEERCSEQKEVPVKESACKSQRREEAESGEMAEPCVPTERISTQKKSVQEECLAQEAQEEKKNSKENSPLPQD